MKKKWILLKTALLLAAICLTAPSLRTEASGNVKGQEAEQSPEVVASQASDESLFKVNEYGTLLGFADGVDVSSVTDIVIPSSVNGVNITFIGNKAFYQNTYLKSVAIQEGPNSIGTSTFEGCTSLTSVSFPNSMKEMRDRAFYGDESLQEVYLPDSIDSIGESAFENCTGITSLHISSSLTAIPKHAFSGLNKCTELIIPSGVATIGDWAFQGWEALEELTIPDSVKTIGQKAFANLWSIKTLTVPNSVTTAGQYAFADCKALESMVWSRGAAMIDAYTFKGCLSLKDVTIPDTVKVIQSAAFRSTGLQKLYIPKSVTVIGNATFTDCQLTEVIFEDPSTLQVCGTPASGYYAFGNQVTKVRLFSVSDGSCFVDFGADGFRDAARITLSGSDFDNLGDGVFQLKDPQNPPADITYSYNIVEGNDATVISGKPTLQKINVYKTVFMCDGKTLDTKYSLEDGKIYFPEIPKKERYTGIWDWDGEGIKEDKTFHVIYKAYPAIVTSYAEVPLNAEFDPYKYFEFRDADGNKLDMNSVVFTGSADTRKPGIYTLTYQATDQWGGTISGECKVEIKNPADVDKSPNATQKPDSGQNQNAGKVNTGDGTDMLMWSLLALISVGIIFTFYFFRQKKMSLK